MTGQPVLVVIRTAGSATISRVCLLFADFSVFVFCNSTLHWYCPDHGTVCSGSSDPFYIVSYYIKWVTSSWTHSNSTLHWYCPEHGKSEIAAHVWSDICDFSCWKMFVQIDSSLKLHFLKRSVFLHTCVTYSCE